jgi:hypothetical protein
MGEIMEEVVLEVALSMLGGGYTAATLLTYPSSAPEATEKSVVGSSSLAFDFDDSALPPEAFP